MLEEGRIKSRIDQSRLGLANLEISRLKARLDEILCEVKGGDLDDKTLDKIKVINEALEMAEESISDIKEEESKRLIFRSRAKWSEEGEKSTKYFLNLLKDRQKKLQIRKIISNGNTFLKQDEISKAIETFYKNLYSKKPELKKISDGDKMFENLPKLDDNDRNMLKEPISLEELTKTLDTCKESAPGQDGISYNTYRALWAQAGPLILGSWEHSNRINETSVTQKKSIITLLDKKDKDRSIIENLRPISLSNCDIKICTKAIALRTNKILHKLVDKVQTGYVPGRQVTDNNRLIEEIIDMAHEKNEIYYLITLDARKAFDSVDHGYLLDILQRYNFPQEYINWIKLLYTNLESSVLVNGYMTDTFRIEQSVKQGDALSCALFVLSIEPLIRAIRNNKSIEPILVNEGDDAEGESVNSASYADDITALTRSLEAIQQIINEYDKFSSYSGIDLNVAKTEIMILGKKDNVPVRFNLQSKGVYELVDQQSVKICGITFSNNKDLSYKYNILNKITKLERQLDIWKGRRLTLEGKILIVKTFGISQLVYSLQSTSIRKEELRKIEDLIFRFVWNIKKSNTISSGKINRATLKSGIDKGGLNAPDIESINKSIKYKNLLRHTQSGSNHPLASLYKNKLRKYNFSFTEFQSSANMGGFLGLGIEVHANLGKNMLANIKEIHNDDGIHKNYHSYVQNINLIKNRYTNVNQNNMLHRLYTYNIKTFYQLYNEKVNPRFPNLSLDVQMIFHSFPIELRILIARQTRLHDPVLGELEVGINKWVKIEQIRVRDIRNIVMQKPQHQNIMTKLINKHNIRQDIEYLNPFICIKKGIKDVQIRNLQYKMLHNIYPTMLHLFKWKIKQTPSCGVCDVEETTEHAVFRCEIARKAFVNLALLLKIQPLSYESVLLGTSSTQQYITTLSRNECHGLDYVLIRMKQKLILQREEKVEIVVDEIVRLVRSVIHIEKYNAIKGNNFTKYISKWGWMEVALEV